MLIRSNGNAGMLLTEASLIKTKLERRQQQRSHVLSSGICRRVGVLTFP